MVDPETELPSLDVRVAKQSETYYNLEDVKKMNLPPWVICSIASGMPTSRDQAISNRNEINKMADLETVGYISSHQIRCWSYLGHKPFDL